MLNHGVRSGAGMNKRNLDCFLYPLVTLHPRLLYSLPKLLHLLLIIIQLLIVVIVLVSKQVLVLLGQLGGGCGCRGWGRATRAGYS